MQDPERAGNANAGRGHSRALGAVAALLVAGPAFVPGPALAGVDALPVLGTFALGVGQAEFWDGPSGGTAKGAAVIAACQYAGKDDFDPATERVLEAQCQAACESEGPCIVYDLELSGPGARLRVAIDHFPSRDEYCLDLFDPAGVHVPRGRFIEHCSTFRPAGGLDVYASEIFASSPVPGTWKVRVVPVDVSKVEFRMRAKLEGASPAPDPPVALLPNLRIEPPFEFGFRGPALTASMVMPGTPAVVSCSVNEVLLYQARRCLRFSFGPVNAGDGPLDLSFVPANDVAGAVSVTQRIHHSDGATTTRPAGTASYHAGHGHYHHDGFSKVLLFQVLDGAAGTMKLAGESPKQGFCMGPYMMDDFRHVHQAPQWSFTTDCANPEQARIGLPAGWGDIYPFEVEANFVEFGDNGDGDYVLQVMADPDGEMLETREDDNLGYTYVKVTGDVVGIKERGIGSSPWDPAKRVLQANVPPVAAGSADRTETDRLTPVRFTDQSRDPDGQVLTWRWDFGDGAASTQRNPTHSYAQLGTFKVMLTVTDDAGAGATAEVAKIKVKNIPPAGNVASGEASGAAANEVEANRIDPVAFDDASTDRDGTVVAWAWDFGDGGTSAAKDPRHQYLQLGTFTATVQPTDNDGDPGTLGTRSVRVVNLLPQPAFTFEPRHPIALTPTKFEDASTDRDGSVVAWAWDFGDGNTAHGPKTTHVYTSGGWKRVTLAATDNDGGVARVVRDIYVCMPGLDADALLTLTRIRLAVEGCVHVNGGDLPV